jgi:hypothetical protein
MFIKNNTGAEITEEEFDAFVEVVKDVLAIKKKQGFSIIQSAGI